MSQVSQDENFREKPSVVFSIDLRKNLPKSKGLQYFNILIKYLPLVMISHDLNLTEAKSTNQILSYLTLTNILKQVPNSVLVEFLLFLILFIAIFFLVVIYQNYKRTGRKGGLDGSVWAKVLKKTSPLAIILVTFNQHLYEVLCWRFLCPVSESTPQQCYKAMHIACIAIGSILILILTLLNYYYNLLLFQPWFNSDSITPVGFSDKHYFWTVLPLLQAYLAIEHNLSSNVSIISRYVLRGIFILYMINFYAKYDKLVYSSMRAYFLITFLNSFCLCSILLEFIPPLVSSLKDNNFVIIKIVSQVMVSIVITYIILTQERRLLSDFNVNKKKSSSNLYEIINRFLYVIINFDKNHEDLISLIFNNFFENKISGEAGSDLTTEPIEIYNKIRSFYKITQAESDCGRIEMGVDSKLKRKDIENKVKILECKLGFLIEYLDELIKAFVVENKGRNDEANVSNLLLYTIFCNLVQQNHVSAFFYLEKVNRMKRFSRNFQTRLYVSYIKSVICEDHEERRFKNNSEKVFLKNFFFNIDNSENIFNFLISSVEALKDLVFKINEKNVALNDFTKILGNIYQKITSLSPSHNKHLYEILEKMNKNSETSILISKYKILIELVFGKSVIEHYNSNFKNNFDIDNYISDGTIYESGMMDSASSNELYMVLHLNHEENIIIDKVCNRLIKNLEYESGALDGIDLRLLIPPKIARFHKEKTTHFTKSNKDFRKLDVYFITRNNYAFPLHMTLIIIPTFDNRIMFFALFTDVNDMNAGLNLGLVKKSNNYFKYTCFAEVSNHCEITKVNKQFESVFGISKELVEAPCSKINIFSKLLKISPEMIFNNYDIVQNYEMKKPLIEFIENLKSINFEEFREHSFEAYNKLKILLSQLSENRSNVDLLISIERRVIDYYDLDDFIYTVKIRQGDIPLNAGSSAKLYDMRHINSICKKTVMSEFKSKDNLTDKPIFNDHEKEKKIVKIISEINKVSSNMLKEGTRLWNGEVRYSDIADFEFESRYQIVELSRIGKDANSNSKYEAGVIMSHPQPSVFKLSRFLFFIFLCLLYGVYYCNILAYLMNRYEDAMNINKVTESLLYIKYSTILASFFVVEAFAVETGKMSINPNVDTYYGFTDLKENIIRMHLQNLDQSIYDFLAHCQKLDQSLTAEITNMANSQIEYKTIFYDFSIFMRNFTIVDVTEKLKVSSYTFKNFNDMVFNIYPSEVNVTGLNNRNLTYDINKEELSVSKASEGDVLIYFIVNNMIDKIIPFSDEIIMTNNKNLQTFLNKIMLYHLIFFSTIFLSLIFIFIFLVCSFYKGKNYVYERYFTNFNTLKFFNFYLITKIHFLEYLIEDFSKINLDQYKNLNYELNPINSVNVRFDLENNELNVFLNEKIKKGTKKDPTPKTLNNSISPRPLPHTKFTMNRNLETLLKVKKEGTMAKSSPGTSEAYVSGNINSAVYQSALNSAESKLRITNGRNIDVLKSLNNGGNTAISAYSTSQLNPIISTHKNILNYDDPKYKYSKFAPKTDIKSISANNVNITQGTNFTQLSSTNNMLMHDNMSNNNLALASPHTLGLSTATRGQGGDIDTHVQNNFTTNYYNNNRLQEEKEKSRNSVPRGKTNYINDDSFINVRNLLQKNSSFYLDFYYIIILIVLLLLLNVIAFILSRENLNSFSYIFDFATTSLQNAYFDVEITLIYACTLLSNKQYFTSINVNASDIHESIYEMKLSDLTTLRQNLITTLQTSENTSLDLLTYQKSLLNKSSCNEVMMTDYTLKNDSTDYQTNINLCQTVANGIFKEGVFLGLQTILNNIDHDYQDNIANHFSKYKDNINDQNMKYIFDSEVDVLQKNIDNIKALVQTDTNMIYSQSISNFNIYFILFSFLSLLLIISYCFIYIFIRKSFKFLEEIEKILINLLR